MSTNPIPAPAFLAKATPDHRPLQVAGLFLILGFALITYLVDLRQGGLFLIGGALGFALFQGSFGFTGGWRNMVVEKRGRGMRAQMLTIAVAAVAMIPLLAAGNIGTQAMVGQLAPVGVSVVLGSLMFGFGMQLGGGCGSGTLFTVGGGSARMLVTLVFFIIGALIGTAHLPWWLEQPSFGTFSLGAEWGVGPAILVTLIGLGAVALITAVIEKRAHGTLQREPNPRREGWSWLLYGPWPLIGAGLALAVLNVATLLLAGHPWSITYGFGLWGAKIAQAIGVNVGAWEFWTWPAQAKALNTSVLADTVSVMDFGLVLGAALAAALAGKFAPKAKIPTGSLIAAIVGGLLMGYGARLSFGCNIGALFSGIASGSLHGWLWFLCAFIGSYVGILARPLFGLDGLARK